MAPSDEDLSSARADARQATNDTRTRAMAAVHLNMSEGVGWSVRFREIELADADEG